MSASCTMSLQPHAGCDDLFLFFYDALCTTPNHLEIAPHTPPIKNLALKAGAISFDQPRNPSDATIKALASLFPSSSFTISFHEISSSTHGYYIYSNGQLTRVDVEYQFLLDRIAAVENSTELPLVTQYSGLQYSI